ncbi:DNA/RNA helicase protein [Quillaja saponaria]|uniref:DNA/RNA helicase protein n=1 Tax=Quillaja saponaria TaxID=32244 RepID=A0AAD7PZL0_QUISA|nr:DNA/RNA helicase protein [Quillaja saponaria]
MEMEDPDCFSNFWAGIEDYWDSSSSTSSSSSSEASCVGFVMADIGERQHYPYPIRDGEKVGLVCELQNVYDENVIKVVNTAADMVGHIKNSVAAVLSPMIKSQLIVVEGILVRVADGDGSKIACRIRIFARLESFPIVKETIEKSGLELLPDSVASSKGKAVKEKMTEIKIKNFDTICKMFDRDVNALEEMDPPIDVIKSDLLVHQKKGLRWLVQRETKDGTGMGKTLTLLSLVAFDKCNTDTGSVGIEKSHKKGGLPASGDKRENMNDMGSSPSKKRETSIFKGKSVGVVDKSSTDMATKTTLVMCPSSALATWVLQLEEHVVLGKLKVYMYYGGRIKGDEELTNYDIVLTTYGTPIQNGSFDLFPLMGFLCFEPFSVKSYWQRLVERPLSQGDQRGLSLLKGLMETISLRRTKETSLIKLPAPIVRRCYFDLSKEERKLYDTMERQAKRVVLKYVDNRSLIPSYAAILSIILQLRQLCTDWALCPSYLESLPEQLEDASSKPELLKKLLEVLRGSEDSLCPICMADNTPSTDITIIVCAHVLCKRCILRILHETARCPICRRHFTKSDLFIVPSASSESVAGSSGSRKARSSKVLLLLHILQESRIENPAIKSVVISQYPKMLMLLKEPLKEAGFKILHIVGTMNASRRVNVIKEFGKSGSTEPTVLLTSLKASGAGMNVTAASRVYFLEPWWNLALEEQVIERIYHVGTKK